MKEGGVARHAAITGSARSTARHAAAPLPPGHVPPPVAVQRLHAHPQHPLGLFSHVVQFTVVVKVRRLRLQIVQQRQHLQIHPAQLRIIPRLARELRHRRDRLPSGRPRPQRGVVQTLQSQLEFFQVLSGLGVADLGQDGGDGVIVLRGGEEGAGGRGEGGLLYDGARVDHQGVIFGRGRIVGVVDVARRVAAVAARGAPSRRRVVGGCHGSL
mmetsp:Transcript_12080/g.26158  ORF Transcript_12080/g.26158 Transcript_12080/m.26158 type:complete len:213 (-) Transcript_12080:128-766(-)